MNRLFSAKPLAAAAIALGAIAATSAAHAGTDVFLSIGVPIGGYVQPAPVYVQPQPVYVQPQPVYVQPRHVYVQPQPVYTPPPVYHGQRRWDERRGAWGDRDGDGIANVYDRDGRRYGHHGYHGQYGQYAYRFGPQGDLDRDGVANRYDRDIDGDGIRNRHDRFPGNPYRR